MLSFWANLVWHARLCWLIQTKSHKSKNQVMHEQKVVQRSLPSTCQTTTKTPGVPVAVSLDVRDKPVLQMFPILCVYEKLYFVKRNQGATRIDYLWHSIMLEPFAQLTEFINAFQIDFTFLMPFFLILCMKYAEWTTKMYYVQTLKKISKHKNHWKNCRPLATLGFTISRILT